MKVVKIGIAKEKFYAAKKPVKVRYVNADHIAISKLVKTEATLYITNKYLIGYLNKNIKLLVLIMPKMSGYGYLKLKIKSGNYCPSV